MSKKQAQSPQSGADRMWDIKGEMVKARVTNVQIARAEKVSPNYVYLVLCEERKGYRIRRAIAKAVGKPVEQLWPDTPPQHRSAA